MKIINIGKSAAKPRTGERSTTRAEMLVGRSLPKWNAPKSKDMVNDIVYALVKARENPYMGTVGSNAPVKRLTALN